MNAFRGVQPAIVALLCSGCVSAALPGGGAELPAEVARFTSLMNAHRASIGCPSLEWDERIAMVAQSHSEDMVTRRFRTHDDPEGRSPGDRLDGAGIVWSAWAENIAWDLPTGDAVLNSWLGSPEHAANLENCSFTNHGVGLHREHWTHVFVRR
ncbi:MAG: CAP domain-containing protein [Gemmatimonadota bacterium]|nr:CAP domain-containing protein [Gemmatimonadota bacterium]